MDVKTEKKTVSFFVPGVPRPGGSKKAIPLKTGKIAIVDACAGNKEWKAAVAYVAHSACPRVLEGALSVFVTFLMPRPMAHYRANGELKPSSTLWHCVRPDATKLWRAAEDAMTGIVWRDDAQISAQTIEKRYADDAPGMKIIVAEL